MAQLMTLFGYVSNLNKAILEGLDESEKDFQTVSILIAKWIVPLAQQGSCGGAAEMCMKNWKLLDLKQHLWPLQT